ncbi:MAG: DUF4238 domain-containing protein [Planctomycetes bacterium]|nr:DUF4238 domain-containing protein [Planctomycetota bacterium]
MADRLNQHWVPQYYFRLFSNGTSRIHLLLKSQDCLVLNAPIRGQCARRKFYGPPEFESALATIESTDAAVIRRAIAHAWKPEAAMQHEDHGLICRACVFQRARTSLEANKGGAALESFGLYAFRHHLAMAPGIDDRERLLAAIDSGQCKVNVSRQYAVALAMSEALRGATFLLDLGVRLLRNRTDSPFIFGDAPVIFANPLLAKIHSRGVLGLTSPGLIVVWPFDSRTMLLLLDEAAYEGEVVEGEVVDVVNRGDVSQLNALQLHHSEAIVYFGSSDAAPYVERLWNAHKSKIVRPRIQFHERSDWLLDGEPTETPIMQMFEPQLNLSLALTILRPRFCPKEPYQFRRRNPEFFTAVQEMLAREPDCAGH